MPPNTSSTHDEQVTAQFRRDLSSKHFDCFPVCASEQQRGFQGIIYFTKDVPMDKKDFGESSCMVIEMVFVTATQSGFTRVPITSVSKGKSKFMVAQDALPLSEMKSYTPDSQCSDASSVLFKMAC
jgi:hypothetical protein